MTFADKVISLTLIVISVIALVFQGFGSDFDNGKIVRITVDGELYGQYDFPQNERTLKIKTKHGENLVKFDKKSVWVEDASCPDKLDVKAGKIEKAGQVIICLPNRLMIEISGNEEKVDKVTY